MRALETFSQLVVWSPDAVSLWSPDSIAGAGGGSGVYTIRNLPITVEDRPRCDFDRIFDLLNGRGAISIGCRLFQGLVFQVQGPFYGFPRVLKGLYCGLFLWENRFPWRGLMLE